MKECALFSRLLFHVRIFSLGEGGGGGRGRKLRARGKVGRNPFSVEKTLYALSIAGFHLLGGEGATLSNFPLQPHPS